MQTIMQDEGVMVQPYWRAVIRHARPTVYGADAQATFEHHHYNWWMAPA